MRTTDRKLGDLNRRCPCCDRPVGGLSHTIGHGPRVTPCGCRVAYWFDQSGVVNVKEAA